MVDPFPDEDDHPAPLAFVVPVLKVRLAVPGTWSVFLSATSRQWRLQGHREQYQPP